MQDWITIYSNIEQELAERKAKKIDDGYLAQQAHYDELIRLFKNKDYGDLLSHLNFGLAKFENLLSSLRYYNHLLELKKHLVYENQEDEKIRLTKLSNAVLSDDPKVIEDALHNGCLVVILDQTKNKRNNHHEAEESIVTSCVIHGQSNSLRYFYQKLNTQDFIDSLKRTVKRIPNVNPVLDLSTNYTYLHFITENCPDLLFDYFHNSDFALDFKTLEGKTALFMACERNQTLIAFAFLKQNTNPNIGIQKGDLIITPLYLAIETKNPFLAQLLIEHGAVVNDCEMSLLVRKILNNPNDMIYRKNFKCVKEDYIEAEKARRTRALKLKNENLLKHLVQAIGVDNVGDLENAMSHGALKVIHHSYKKSFGYTPMTIVLVYQKHNSLKFFYRQLTKNEFISALKAQTTQPKKPIQIRHNPYLSIFKKYTLLEFIVENNLIDVLITYNSLLKFINDKTDSGKTVLHIACEKGYTDLAQYLLENGADSNTCINQGGTFISLLYLAIQQNNTKLAQALVNHNVKIDKASFALLQSKIGIDPNLYKNMYNILKKPFKYIKEQTKLKASVRQTFFNLDTQILPADLESPEFLLRALKSRIYADNEAGNLVIDKKLDSCFHHDNKNNILMPLLKVAALASMCIRSKRDNKKKLTAIVSDSSVSDYIMNPNHHNIYGLYPGKNTIFVFGNDKEGSLFHELKHFVDNEVFGSNLKSFFPQHQAEFERIRYFLFMKIEMGKFPKNDEALRHIEASFRVTFDTSKTPEAHRNIEILARVPEVLGVLGVKQGTEWLEKYTPELLNFYKNVYNPIVEEYIEKKKSELSAPSSPITTATANTNGNVNVKL
jgi:ankyrin repeat protein